MNGDTTQHLIDGIRAGDSNAMNELLTRLFPELRRLAHHELKRERSQHTLSPTELVHEAFIRVHGKEDDWASCRPFLFQAFAQEMRRVLIDHAKSRNRQKRGGGAVPDPLTSIEVPATTELDPVDRIAIDAALDELAERDRQCFNVAMLRYFVGLTFEEIGAVLGVTAKIATRHWKFAQHWLALAVDPDRTRL